MWCRHEPRLDYLQVYPWCTRDGWLTVWVQMIRELIGADARSDLVTVTTGIRYTHLVNILVATDLDSEASIPLWVAKKCTRIHLLLVPLVAKKITELSSH
jgi:hypothetical protein